MNYIIATSRPWNEILCQNLAVKTGHHFHLISGKNNLTIEKLQQISPRYIFFPHWSFIIPRAIHEAYECVIFHMTDLPYGRGGSPLQNLIVRGHSETQMTALRCISEIDAGPIYMKRPLSLLGSASEIFLRSAQLMENMITEIFQAEPSPIPQQGEVVNFCRRTPDDSNLLESKITSLNDFFDNIRMLDAEGYPKAYLDLHGHRIEFSRVQFEQDKLVGTFVIHRNNCNPDSI